MSNAYSPEKEKKKKKNIKNKKYFTAIQNFFSEIQTFVQKEEGKKT